MHGIRPWPAGSEAFLNLAVTAGYISSGAREDLFSAMDAANVDLKAFTDDFYQRLYGGHLVPVLETLEYLKQKTRVWIELTTLLIPGHNDSDAELERMCAWVREHLSPETLTRAWVIARRNGIRYAYTGNVQDTEGGSTWCHQYGALLIERDWYRLRVWGLTPEGKCAACAGHFEPKPGTWGARRLPVSMPT